MTIPQGAPELALAWHRDGLGAVLATVVETWGSAPRPSGSQMVMDGQGHLEGSVSGGCVEGAVVVEALEALEGDGAARLLDYGVSDDEAFAVGLACGGRIRVLVEPVGGALPVAVLEQLVEARAARRGVAYVAALDGPDRSVRAVADLDEGTKPGLQPDGATFVAFHQPPLRMVVVGGVHIAQALIPMAQTCGYDVTLVDPRPAFGSPQRFAGVTLCDDWPDEALEALKPDARTAVVTLTHDPKLDDPAIRATLGSEAFYLGCLGSTRTHAKRVARLQEAGFAAGDIARIHGPVGLDLGGRSPGEIAVSIMAEITRKLHRS